MKIRPLNEMELGTLEKDITMKEASEISPLTAVKTKQSSALQFPDISEAMECLDELEEDGLEM